jgi:flagellar hook-length control protein FliK
MTPVAAAQVFGGLQRATEVKAGTTPLGRWAPGQSVEPLPMAIAPAAQIGTPMWPHPFGQGIATHAEPTAEQPPRQPAMTAASTYPGGLSAELPLSGLPSTQTTVQGARADAPTLQHAPFVGAAAPVPVPAANLTELLLPTPVYSPEFKEALGIQVSLLARDGIQQAELHLNPAEMGPISVRIALDGQRAQVDFGVDSAATRALVESGLPELAAALREGGLTLTGGGVSQHARGDGPGAQGGRSGDGSHPPGAGHDGRRPGGRDGHPAGDQPPPRPRTVRSNGGVDLYA